MKTSDDEILLRDWFAGQALDRVIERMEILIHRDKTVEPREAKAIAETCYEIAAAMINERGVDAERTDPDEGEPLSFEWLEACGFEIDRTTAQLISVAVGFSLRVWHTPGGWRVRFSGTKLQRIFETRHDLLDLAKAIGCEFQSAPADDAASQVAPEWLLRMGFVRILGAPNGPAVYRRGPITIATPKPGESEWLSFFTGDLPEGISESGRLTTRNDIREWARIRCDWFGGDA